MSAPKFVNTADGTCWSRREATRDGEPLYALASCESCPELVMATYAELAEHGIVGSADVLPVPVGPLPSERDRLRAAFIEALDSAAKTHPCPALGDQFWSGCVHYDEAGHVTGVGSCHSGRRADAVLAVRDVELERLRARVAELEAGVAWRDAERGRWSGVRYLVEKAIDKGWNSIDTWELEDALGPESAPVPAEPVAEPACPCPPEDPPAPIQADGFFDGVPVSPPSERPVDAVAPLFPTVASLREASSREEPHDSPNYHSYRLGHDMPDGCRLSGEQVQELGNPFLGGGA